MSPRQSRPQREDVRSAAIVNAYAGRYVLDPGGASGLDLATAADVRIRRLPRAATLEELKWEEDCASRFLSDDSDPLVDFGWIGRAERFEAYARGWRRAMRFAGSVIEHDTLSEFAHLLSSVSDGDVRVMTVTHGSRCSDAAAWHLARIARIAGFVPLDAGVAAACGGSSEGELLCGVVILARTAPAQASGGDAVRALLRRAGSGVPLVVLMLTPLRIARGYRTRRARFQVRETSDSYEPHGRGTDRPGHRGARRLACARSAARRGRIALATARFRFAVRAFARRGEAHLAGAAALELAELLRRRGELATLDAVLTAATDHFRHAEDVGGETAALTLRSLVAADEGKLAAAEVMARSAVVAARQTGDRVLLGRARPALARCLYWQGRYDEADVLVSEQVEVSPGLDAARWMLVSRIAVARADGGAVQAALTSVEHARRDDDPALLANAWCALARARASVGDSDGVRAALQYATATVRPTRSRLAVLRVRVVAIESLVRLGRVADARRMALALTGASLKRAPALLRARVQVALDPEAAAAFITQSGACALGDVPRGRVRMDVMHDVVDILHACQDVDESHEGLSRLCGLVRERLQASATAVYASADARRAPMGLPIAVAGAATTVRGDVAQRAMETGQLVPLSRNGLSMDAAAPVRYGGGTIAALLARWPGDALVDGSRAAALLTAAAAACAPAVRAALDRPACLATEKANATVDLLGTSSGIEEVRRAIELAGPAPFPVLIEGESGSGKELVARAVHRNSPRRERKFCAVNCAALTDELMEAELFGHARGAFTGAVAERAGLFEEADGGTLLLDEVGELSARGQAKLLRVIQEGEVRRIGENFSRKVDVRIIAATNRPLAGEAAAGRFRTDLLYRLDVLRIVVPPLRGRREDVPLLAEHFWHAAVSRTGVRAALDAQVLAALARYDWPGNVRELQNVMAALAVRAPRRGRVGPASLPEAIATAARHPCGETLEEARKVFETRFVRAALARAGGHRGRAAADLGVSRQGLAKLMARLEIELRTSQDA